MRRKHCPLAKARLIRKRKQDKQRLRLMSHYDKQAYEEYQERIRSEQVPATTIFRSEAEREAHELKSQLCIEIHALFEKRRQGSLSNAEEKRFQELLEYFTPSEETIKKYIIYDDD